MVFVVYISTVSERTDLTNLYDAGSGIPWPAFTFPLLPVLCITTNDTMRELLNDLIEQLDFLENEHSTAQDWGEFLEAARDLHERAIVLRYKSLEKLKSTETRDEPEEPDEATAVVWGQPLNESQEQEQAPEPAPTVHPGDAVSLAEKLSLKPLDAIMPALGINDRVRFAGVLFNGDMNTLKNACAAVEGAASYDEAMNLLHTFVSSDLDWKDEEEAPFQFMQLVQRVHI